MNRREYLASAATTGLSLISTSSERVKRKFEFGNVVDAVQDANCDPTGEERCGDEIRRALTNDTLLRFPPGTYKLEERIQIEDVERIGIRGGGDVTFRPERGNNDLLFSFDVGELLFENVTVDVRQRDTTAGIQAFASKRFHIADITYRGRGLHPDGSVTNALMPACRSHDATGVVRNLVAKQGSAWGHYKGGDGRVGVWIGSEHKGTVKLIDLDLREFGNNAIYASRTPGNVQVRGGYFLNNNAAAVRISGKGSYVDGATIEVDPSKYTGPQSLTDSEWYFNGVRIEQGELGPEYKPAGVEVRNCTIRIADAPFQAIAIELWETARTLTVKDTTITHHNDSPAILRAPRRLQSDLFKPPNGSRWVRMENVTVTGTGTGDAAIVLIDAPDSALRHSRIRQTGEYRDGMQFIQSPNSVVTTGRIETTGYPIAAKIPEGIDSSTCLLRIDGSSSIDTSAGEPPSHVKSESVHVSRDASGSGDGSRDCLTTDELPSFRSDRPQWLLLTGANDSAMLGFVVVESGPVEDL